MKFLILLITFSVNCGGKSEKIALKGNNLLAELQAHINNLPKDFGNLKTASLRQIEAFELNSAQFQLMYLELENDETSNASYRSNIEVYLKKNGQIIERKLGGRWLRPDFEDLTDDGTQEVILELNEAGNGATDIKLEVFDVSKGKFDVIFASAVSFGAPGILFTYDKKFDFRKKRIEVKETVSMDDCFRDYMKEFFPKVKLPKDYKGIASYVFRLGKFQPQKTSNFEKVQSRFEEIISKFGKEKTFSTWNCGCGPCID